MLFVTHVTKSIAVCYMTNSDVCHVTSCKEQLHTLHHYRYFLILPSGAFLF